MRYIIEGAIETPDKRNPEHGLKEGDIGTVVLVHNGGAGYEVEFTTIDGGSRDTISDNTFFALNRDSSASIREETIVSPGYRKATAYSVM